MAYRKYHGVIVDPIMDTRMRLKQATQSVQDFGSTLNASSCDEALHILEGDQIVDVVFVTGRIPQQEFAEFVVEAKKTKQGQDSAYVLVLKSQTDSQSELASAMMAGADGILCEPYSVEQLVEITKLAARVRKERSDARERAAIGMIIDDVITQLDLVSFLKACGCEPGTSIKALRDLGDRIAMISSEHHEAYFEIIEEKMKDLPPPKKAFQTKVYGGASSRVRQQMEKRIYAELSARKKSDAKV
ncbi:MAG: hypothetical protein GYA55_06870 [SAR324 cluster bacterium]|uniref:Response regulatory domain-containing protein n=1 Tax=SAR324 cluster bacterium TaxID=2024889 RepID=A0A7X9IK72_9DELT|nr:hypothetical protein [SAR324 cluster bacterium]